MGTQLGKIGSGYSSTSTTNGTRIGAARACVPLPGGGVAVVVLDRNHSGAVATHGDATNVPKLKIFFSIDRISFFLVATVSPTAAIAAPYFFGVDAHTDGSLALVWVSTGGIYHRKITISGTAYSVASSAWTVGAETQVVANPAGIDWWLAVDVSVSDSNTVLVAAMVERFSSPWDRIQYGLYGQRSGVGTWDVVKALTDISNFISKDRCNAISVAWAKGAAPEGGRSYSVIHGATASNSDLGYSAYRARVASEGALMAELSYTSLFVSQGASQLDLATAYTTYTKHCQVVPTDVDNEFQYAFMTIAPEPSCYIARYQAVTGAWVPIYTPTRVVDSTMNYNANLTVGAISIGKDAVNFIVTTKNGSQSFTRQRNYGVKLYPTTATYKVTSAVYWNNEENLDRHIYLVLGSGGHYAWSTTKMDSYYHWAYWTTGAQGNLDDSGWAYHHYSKNAAVPLAQTPVSGSTITSSTPGLTSNARLGIKLDGSSHKTEWRFATDAAMTTNLRTFTQADSKLVSINNTEGATSFLQFSDVLPSLYELAQGNWYMQSRTVDLWGNGGTWLANASPVVVSHPPSPAEIQPSGDQLLLYGTGQVTFGWKFTDPSPTDYQTAFQVLVEVNSTGTVIYDSGKVPSTSPSHVATIPAGNKDMSLRWTVRLWDKDDVAGSYAAYQTFYIADSPVVPINAPTVNQAITSGIPSVTFTPTVGGGRTITKYRAVFTQFGVAVHDSGLLSTAINSGQTVTYTAPNTVFKNNQGYSVQVTVIDSLGLEGKSSVVPFTVSFVVPASPTGVVVSTTQFSNEATGGYVSVLWSDTGRDVDFQAWAIYRRDDITDPNTGAVIGPGELKLIDYVYEPNVTGYEYRDYYAPSGYKVSYLVTQVVNRFGDVVESSNTTESVSYPKSEGYWLIELTELGATGTVLKLSSITQDDYTDEYEESEYNVIGRGRHVDRGDYLGKKGTLTAKLRDSAGVSARQKKIQLENIKKYNSNLYLRNPFGDIFKVYVGNLGVSRLAGTGTSEHVDVSIPYSEVYE